MSKFDFTYAGTNEKIEDDNQTFLAIPEIKTIFLPKNQVSTTHREVPFGGNNNIFNMVLDWNSRTTEAHNIIKESIEKLESTEKYIKSTLNDIIVLDELKKDLELDSILKRLDIMYNYLDYLEGEIACLSSKECNNLGFELVKNDKNHARLKFPIKFIKLRNKSYDEIVGFSHNTQ